MGNENWPSLNYQGMKIFYAERIKFKGLEFKSKKLLNLSNCNKALFISIYI